MTAGGDIGIVSLDTDTGKRTRYVLHTALQTDDHNVPGLAVDADGHLHAFYSKHSVNGGVIYHRRSTNPEDVSAWGPVVEIDENVSGPTGVSYPKPAFDADGRLWLFFRGATSSQVFTYSDDNGDTWAPAARWFTSPDGRPYVNFNVDTATGRIDFIATNAHPSEAADVSLYHWYLLGGNVYKTDGTLISAVEDISDQYGLRAQDVTLIYDGEGSGSWGWDMTLDADGHPRVAFASFEDSDDHTYRYARWTGSAWHVETVCQGGGNIDSEPQPHYSGGLSILPSDPDVVFVSREVGTTWEVERWVHDGDGWSFGEAITTDSGTAKQVRPTCPDPHYPGAPEVAWMSGRYTTYLNYDTDLLIWPPA